MGVLGAWPFLAENGASGTAVDTTQLDGDVYVDMLALYYGFIVTTSQRMYEEYARKSRPIDYPAVWTVLARKLSAKIDQTFSKANAQLLFDGPPNVQKNKAHTERQGVRNQADTACRTTLAELNVVVQQESGLQPGMISSPRKRRQRLARSLKVIRTKWRQASKPDTRMLSAIMTELANEGWNVVTCLGEADVHVARLERAITGDGGITVVTSDSDMLFHNISTVIRQDPSSKSRFWRFEVPKLRKELEISEEAWTLCAVLSENDYTGAAPQEPKRLIANVFESLWSLEHGGVPRPTAGAASDQASQPAAHNPKTTDELLTAYCAQVGTVPGSYQHALDIFLNLNEIFVQGPAQAPSDLDSLVITAIQQVSVLFTSYRQEYRLRRSLTRAAKQGLSAAPLPARDSQGYDKAGRRDRYHRLRRHTMLQPQNMATIPDPAPAEKKRRVDRQAASQPLYDTATRRARRSAEEEATTAGPTRRLEVSTIFDHYLSGAHFKQVALVAGTAGQSLQKTLGNGSALAQEVRFTLNELARLGTNLTWALYQALSLYVSAAFIPYPTMSDHDRDHRKVLLEPIAYSNSYRPFEWFLSKLVLGESKRGEDVAGQGMYSIFRDAVQTATNKSLSEALELESPIKSCLTDFIKAIAVRVQDAFQAHHFRNVSELKKRLVAGNGPFASSAEGIAFLQSIGDDGKSTTFDPISVFWILNVNLPRGQRMAFSPEAGYTDQHFHFTERMLLEVLLRTRGATATEVGDGADRYGQGTPVHIRSDLAQVCGVPENHLRDLPSRHPGHLISCLFMHRRMEYKKKVCFIDPIGLEPSLLPQRQETMAEYQIHRNVLETYDTTDPLYAATRKGPMVAGRATDGLFAAFLRTTIGTPGNLQFQPTYPYVLTGTITSNGYEIKPLAYDIRKREAPPAKFKRALNTLPTVPYVSANDWNEASMYEPVVVGIDPGLRSPATATILGSLDPDVVSRMSIKSGVFKSISTKYRKELERAKISFTDEVFTDIKTAEGTIVPVQCEQLVQGQERRIFANMFKSVSRNVISKLRVLRLLRRFYGSKTFKVKLWQRGQASRGEWDAALDNMIQAAENIAVQQPPRPTPEGQLAVQLFYELPQLMDVSEDEPESSLVSSVGQYAERQERRVIFALGDGEFTDLEVAKDFARSLLDR
ncbi:hypothetical protein BGZ72_004326 [Mortierella alpina]|nr:hypothetical protein BGZ72_004326 [Mortierella alpina]